MGQLASPTLDSEWKVRDHSSEAGSEANSFFAVSGGGGGDGRGDSAGSGDGGSGSDDDEDGSSGGGGGGRGSGGGGSGIQGQRQGQWHYGCLFSCLGFGSGEGSSLLSRLVVCLWFQLWVWLPSDLMFLFVFQSFWLAMLWAVWYPFTTFLLGLNPPESVYVAYKEEFWLINLCMTLNWFRVCFYLGLSSPYSSHRNLTGPVQEARSESQILLRNAHLLQQ